MTSPAKIAANRRNAQKSTGPRSAAGKARIRNNALRHGLARFWSFDAAEDKRIEELELALTGGEDTYTPQAEVDLATLAAEAEVEILRVRRAKVVMINTAAARLLDDEGRPVPVKEAAALAFARQTKRLLAIERYERRALARRKRALRMLRTLELERQRQQAIECVGPPRPKPLRSSDNLFEQTVLRLDLRRLMKAPLPLAFELLGGFYRSYHWEFPAVSVRVHVKNDGDHAVLTLTVRADGESIYQQFVLRRTAMRVGGVQWSVKCPETGKMVRDLYLGQWQRHFRSRHALGLIYHSKMVTPSERYSERASKLMDRIGAQYPEDKPPRPKFMRRSTYQRLLMQIEEAHILSMLTNLGWSLDNFVGEGDNLEYRPPPKSRGGANRRARQPRPTPWRFFVWTLQQAERIMQRSAARAVT